MNLALALVIALLLVLVVLCLLFYMVMQQDLKAIRDKLGTLEAPSAPPPSRTAETIRRERSAAHDKIVLLEASLSTQPRDGLTPEEMAAFEDARRVIRACNAELKRTQAWLGLPFDLDWPEVQARLPKLNGLYTQAIKQALGESESGAA